MGPSSCAMGPTAQAHRQMHGCAAEVQRKWRQRQRTRSRHGPRRALPSPAIGESCGRASGHAAVCCCLCRGARGGGAAAWRAFERANRVQRSAGSGARAATAAAAASAGPQPLWQWMTRGCPVMLQRFKGPLHWAKVQGRGATDLGGCSGQEGGATYKRVEVTARYEQTRGRGRTSPAELSVRRPAVRCWVP